MMSSVKKLNKHTAVFYGNSPQAGGAFVGVKDNRYKSDDPKDKDFLMVWTQDEGFGINLIKATLTAVRDTDKMIALVDNYIRFK